MPSIQAWGYSATQTITKYPHFLILLHMAQNLCHQKTMQPMHQRVCLICLCKSSTLSSELSYALCESGNLRLSVALLLALKLYDLRWRICHKALVAELLLHTNEEAL